MTGLCIHPSIIYWYFCAHAFCWWKQTHCKENAMVLWKPPHLSTAPHGFWLNQGYIPSHDWHLRLQVFMHSLIFGQRQDCPMAQFRPCLISKWHLAVFHDSANFIHLGLMSLNFVFTHFPCLWIVLKLPPSCLSLNLVRLSNNTLRTLLLFQGK